MLSIIIPTLNEEKYLPRLLESIQKQDFQNYEIIVADAGSKDKTIEIAKNFSCKITKGGLPAKGRNEGAKIAQGETFLFMDADNIYLPENFLGNLISEFKKRNFGVASFPIYPNGKKIDKIIYGIYNYFVWLTKIPLATNSVLIKREIFEKIEGFNEKIKIGEDHDFTQRASKISPFGFIKTKPVFTSSRRLEKDGRFKTYLKYILVGLHMLFLGPVKSDLFQYRFDDLDEQKK